MLRIIDTKNISLSLLGVPVLGGGTIEKTIKNWAIGVPISHNFIQPESGSMTLGVVESNFSKNNTTAYQIVFGIVQGTEDEEFLTNLYRNTRIQSFTNPFFSISFKDEAREIITADSAIIQNMSDMKYSNNADDAYIEYTIQTTNIAFIQK